ncbi:hypothetical protein Y1Q_0020207 [Alligator mississippiensis]|uniref:Uncharacterized protein n=1 Tax=Alligator mississippiensis TaxID=8496 RepID=A0A151PIG7_ALLMI|nr:hypothetical protein Y1Q_0020207 [Alligator mississippiensis]
MQSPGQSHDPLPVHTPAQSMQAADIGSALARDHAVTATRSQPGPRAASHPAKCPASAAAAGLQETLAPGYHSAAAAGVSMETGPSHAETETGPSTNH